MFGALCGPLPFFLSGLVTKPLSPPPSPKGSSTRNLRLRPRPQSTQGHQWQTIGKEPRMQEEVGTVQNGQTTQEVVGTVGNGQTTH